MTSPASTSSSATPLRLIQMVRLPGSRPLTWPSVRSTYPSRAMTRQAMATCSRSSSSVVTIASTRRSVGG